MLSGPSGPPTAEPDVVSGVCNKPSSRHYEEYERELVQVG
jgi:hypothetical protein